jgi:uncharacterized protein YndB with AHSA1/START domain
MKRPAPTLLAAAIGLLPIIGTAARAAAAQASAEIAINAPAERVWQLLTGVDAWPRWNPLVDAADLDGSLAPGSVFCWKSQGFSVTSTLVTVDAPTRLAWHGEAFGTRAHHEWEIVPSGQGVVVRTSETFDGWLPRLMPGAMQKTLEDTLPRWLAALKAEAERS